MRRDAERTDGAAVRPAAALPVPAGRTEGRAAKGPSSGCRQRLPPWLKHPVRRGPEFERVSRIVAGKGLHTVCSGAACPNRAECWNAGTATFLVLGPVCTRSCSFCNVTKGGPGPVDPGEPLRVAEAVALLGLRYSVVTSVTRDDLADGGASVFAETIRAIRAWSPGCRVEVLVPDFQGDEAALSTVLSAGPDVLNHNVETVPSLYGRIRPQAVYRRSLELIRRSRDAGAVTKTGLMVGLGEGRDEVHAVLADVRDAGCELLTIGQYLQPSAALVPVQKYYRPEEFESLRDRALAMGFRHVAAGPLVRSSYQAEKYGAEHAQNPNI